MRKNFSSSVLKSFPFGKGFRIGLLFVVFSLSVCKAQWVTIPDANFVAWLQTSYPSCMNGNLMDTTCTNILIDSTVYFNGSSIADLTGIGYFKGLKTLNIQNINISSLPVLPDSLENLDLSFISIDSIFNLPNRIKFLNCYNIGLKYISSLPDSLLNFNCVSNQLHSIPTLPSKLRIFECTLNPLYYLPSLLPDSLRELWCNHDSLYSLPTLPNKINWISCIDNNLISLPALPDSLIHLSAYTNPLASLPALPNQLKWLILGSNNLTTLPALPASLIYLDVPYSQLTSLPALPDSLQYLRVEFNQLDSLPAIPERLRVLMVNSNQLTELPYLPDPLPNKPVSEYLYLKCNNNLIQSIPHLPNKMNALVCGNNPLTCLPQVDEIYLTQQSQLWPWINSSGFSIYGTGINCISNYIQHPTGTNVWDELDAMPICDPMNSNSCPSHWNIQGTVSYDSDGSCSTLNDGISTGGIKVLLIDSTFNISQQFITNPNGNYSFNAPIAPYHLRIDTANLPFDIICPSGNLIDSTLTFSDSMHTNVNFRVVCNSSGTFDNGVWNVTRDQIFFPNNVTDIHVHAGNLNQNFYNGICSSAGISGEVRVVLSDTVSYVTALAGSLTPVLSGDTLIYSIPDFALINSNSDFAFSVQTDSTVQLGDEICFHVIVTPPVGDIQLSNNDATFCFPVSNSFDPNEKEVNPLGILSYPYTDWLTYTIHFQNTGNAPAQNIKVEDILDSDIDQNSFQLLTLSDSAQVQLIGNKILFLFNNINLPDSTADLEGSKGLISYRVKLKTALSINAKIKNKASIYFDFNSPILTNQVVSEFCIPQVQNLSEDLCFGDIYNFNGQQLTTSGNYTTIYSLLDGCDSVVNLSLNVLPQNLHSYNDAICFGDSLLFDLQYQSVPGIYYSYLTNFNGCDSIIELHLDVFNPIIHSFTHTICEGDIYNFGGQQLTASGNYSATYSAFTGCDSVANLSLQVFPSTSSNISQTICVDEVLNFHGQQLSTPGNYSATLISASGCDSVVNLSLSIEEINTTVLQWGDSLIVISNGTAHWINCYTGLMIGFIGNIFVPTSPGNYAAIITVGSCSDTSYCFNIIGDGINDLTINHSPFTIFPNPTDDEVTMQLSQPCEKCRIEITNTLGQLLFSKSINDKVESINLELLPAGVYFVALRSAQFSAVKKLIKQ